MADESAARVLRLSAIEPLDRGHGVRTFHLTRREVGTREMLTGITEFDVGAEVAPHSHNCEESVLILEGEAVFEADDRRHDLVAGDATWTPPRVIHRFANRGERRLRIYWTYGSADATRTIDATGETVAVGSEARSTPQPAQKRPR
jgi:quercetin dioxygenase-like cupin family protein